jgi:hypothetical protein
VPLVFSVEVRFSMRAAIPASSILNNGQEKSANPPK